MLLSARFLLAQRISTNKHEIITWYSEWNDETPVCSCVLKRKFFKHEWPEGSGPPGAYHIDHWSSRLHEVLFDEDSEIFFQVWSSLLDLSTMTECPIYSSLVYLYLRVIGLCAMTIASDMKRAWPIVMLEWSHESLVPHQERTNIWVSDE